MVDAINAINSATRSVAQERKDWTIDWRKLTARQVLEYADKGEDIPPEILRWAEDYAKLINVPDDVSYESVNGSNTPENARSVKEGEEIAEKEVPTDESTDGDNNGGESIPDGSSLYAGAGTLIQESSVKKNEVQETLSDVNTRTAQSQSIAQNAKQHANAAISETNTRKNEYDELIKKFNGDKSNITPGDLIKLAQLAGQLNAAKQGVNTNLTVYDAQLKEIETVFSQYDTLPSVADAKGTETANLGFQLTTDNETKVTDVHEKAQGISSRKFGSLIFNTPATEEFYAQLISSYNARGLHAANAGANLINATAEADTTINIARNANNIALNNNEDSINNIEDITPTEEVNIKISSENQNNNDTTTNKNKEISQETDRRTQNGVVKDSALLADAEELRRRKENRGEIPPENQALS